MILKQYVCDICGHTINNPYEARMREFFMSPDLNSRSTVLTWTPIRSIKRKAHICGDCRKLIAEHLNGA